MRLEDQRGGPTQASTKDCPSVPASTNESQTQSVRHACPPAQSTRQSQPIAVSAQLDPAGQLLELPQEMVQTLPGKSEPVWQSRRSHSLSFMQAPQTRELSFPATPGGRPSSPHPIHDRAAVSRARATKNDLMARGR